MGRLRLSIPSLSLSSCRRRPPEEQAARVPHATIWCRPGAAAAAAEERLSPAARARHPAPRYPNDAARGRGRRRCDAPRSGPPAAADFLRLSAARCGRHRAHVRHRAKAYFGGTSVTIAKSVANTVAGLVRSTSPPSELGPDIRLSRRSAVRWRCVSGRQPSPLLPSPTVSGAGRLTESSVTGPCRHSTSAAIRPSAAGRASYQPRGRHFSSRPDRFHRSRKLGNFN